MINTLGKQRNQEQNSLKLSYGTKLDYYLSGNTIPRQLIDDADDETVITLPDIK